MTKSPQPTHRPGEWPVPRTFLPTSDEGNQHAGLHAQGTRAEQARWNVTLGAIRSHLECPHCHPAPGIDHIELQSIRAHLNEQPSPRTVRAAARHWNEAITNIADEIIRGLR